MAEELGSRGVVRREALDALENRDEVVPGMAQATDRRLELVPRDGLSIGGERRESLVAVRRRDRDLFHDLRGADDHVDGLAMPRRPVPVPAGGRGRLRDGLLPRGCPPKGAGQIEQPDPETAVVVAGLEPEPQWCRVGHPGIRCTSRAFGPVPG